MPSQYSYITRMGHRQTTTSTNVHELGVYSVSLLKRNRRTALRNVFIFGSRGLPLMSDDYVYSYTVIIRNTAFRCFKQHFRLVALRRCPEHCGSVEGLSFTEFRKGNRLDERGCVRLAFECLSPGKSSTFSCFANLLDCIDEDSKIKPIRKRRSLSGRPVPRRYLVAR